MFKRITIVNLIWIVLICPSVFAQDKTKVALATPVNAADAIIKAFEKYDIVALSEGNHNNEQGHEFRLSLINHPQFSSVVNDIVVEFGSSSYQDVIDRFVNGEDVPLNELQKVWQNTTQIHPVWDVPIYEAFFRAVRNKNKTLSEEHKLRVLLGDPPMDWHNIQTKDELITAWNKYDRKSFPVEVIKKEVIEKKRKALVIYGSNHLKRKRLYWQFNDVEYSEAEFKKPLNNIVSTLEQQGVKVFSVLTDTYGGALTVQPEAKDWEIPSVALLKGTLLGAQPFSVYYPVNARIYKGERISYNESKSPVMQEQFDAILYVGAKSSITYSQITKGMCEDADYLKMRIGRMALLNMNMESGLKERCDEILNR